MLVFWCVIFDRDCIFHSRQFTGRQQLFIFFFFSLFVCVFVFYYLLLNGIGLPLGVNVFGVNGLVTVIDDCAMDLDGNAVICVLPNASTVGRERER